jgi:hypothetical protein
VKAQPLLDSKGQYTGLWINCPGCEPGHHVLPTDWTPAGVGRSPGIADLPQWSFNGDMDSPTLSPSILMRCDSWGRDRTSICCHSFVRNGRIEFLSDCTHALAGQTVDLPGIDP